MEQENNLEKEQLQILEKINKEELDAILGLYRESRSMESYVKIPFLLFGVLVLIHNIFIAGNSYDYETYDNIKAIELLIVGVIVFIIFIIAGMAMSKNSKIKELLRKTSEKHNISLEKIQEEFSALGIHLYGGRGVQLKKK